MALTSVTDFVKVGWNVGNAVNAALDSFAKERDRIHAANEAAFATAVSSGTLTPDAQVAYRQKMLDNANAEAVPDQDYVNTLTQSLASTKKIAHQTAIQTKIAKEQADVAGTLKSNQQFLSDLQNMAAMEGDPQLLNEIQGLVTQTQKTITDNKVTLITNEITKGNTTADTNEISKGISDAQIRKAEFLAIGDDVSASSMDTIISQGKQDLTNINISKKLTSLDVRHAMDQNPLDYVQGMKDLIASADATTPIQYMAIGSTHLTPYASEQAYLQSVLAAYVNNRFISDLTTQYGDYINAAKSQAVNGLLPNTVLDQIQADFATLAADPAYALIAGHLQQIGAQVLGAAVKVNADALVNNFGTTNDTNGTMAQLNSLTTKYGIDTSFEQNKIVNSAASQTNSQMSVIGTAANNYLSQNPAMGLGAAYNQAAADFQAGKLPSVIQSNQQLAGETPGQAAKASTPSASQVKSQVNTPALSTPPVKTDSSSLPTPLQQSAAPASSSPVATPAANPPPSGLQAPGLQFGTDQQKPQYDQQGMLIAGTGGKAPNPLSTTNPATQPSK